MHTLMSECEMTVHLQRRLRLFVIWVLRDMGPFSGPVRHIELTSVVDFS